MVMLPDYMLCTDVTGLYALYRRYRIICFVQTLPDYMLLSELIITLTDRIGLFVHDKSHEYRVTETSYYDVTLV